MSDKLNAIIDQIAGLSVLELSELVKALEEKFGVTAAAPVMMGAMPAGGGAEAAPAEEAPTSFNVILKEAKDLVDGAPKPIKENVPEDEAKKIRETLEAVGAVIEVKGVA